MNDLDLSLPTSDGSSTLNGALTGFTYDKATIDAKIGDTSAKSLNQIAA